MCDIASTALHQAVDLVAGQSIRLTPIYVLMHLYRRTTMSKLKLLSDLHTFDVERAS